MSDTNLARSCVHEAGHVLLALIENVAIAEVLANASGTGHVTPADLASVTPLSLLRLACAGNQAEGVVFPKGTTAAFLPRDDGILSYQAQQKLGLSMQKLWAAQEAVGTTLSAYRGLLDDIAGYICEHANSKIDGPTLHSKLDEIVRAAFVVN